MAIAIRRNRTASALTEAEARQLHEQISNLTIELVPIESVKMNPRNAKEHPSQQIGLIGESIKQFGFNHPLLVDEDGMLLGGEGRIAAAHRLNLKQVPVLRYRLHRYTVQIRVENAPVISIYSLHCTNIA